jgi:uncharacterized protein (TIGR02996 family)
MNEEEAFRQAIVESPDDDTPRLIYADWLDDHGDADQANLIRVQCRLARLPDDDPERPALVMLALLENKFGEDIGRASK